MLLLLYLTVIVVEVVVSLQAYGHVVGVAGVVWIDVHFVWVDPVVGFSVECTPETRGGGGRGEGCHGLRCWGGEGGGRRVKGREV